MQDKVTRPWISRQLFLFMHPNDLKADLSLTHEDVLYVLDRLDFEQFIPMAYTYQGRPKEDRCAILRSFVAKSILNCATTRSLIDRLEADPVLRRLMGWERKVDIPSESTFSRAFHEFSKTNVLELIHEHLIKTVYKNRIIGHVSRDSTAIEAREKPIRKAKVIKTKQHLKRVRKPKGTLPNPPPEPTRLAKQLTQTFHEMLKDLPTSCDKAGKKDSKGKYALLEWIQAPH